MLSLRSSWLVNDSQINIKSISFSLHLDKSSSLLEAPEQDLGPIERIFVSKHLTIELFFFFPLFGFSLPLLTDPLTLLWYRLLYCSLLLVSLSFLSELNTYIWFGSIVFFMKPCLLCFSQFCSFFLQLAIKNLVFNHQFVKTQKFIEKFVQN